MRTLVGIWMLGLALTPTAVAQQRPSLDGTQAAVCAAADVRGDSYRPVFCDPQCGCGFDPAFATDCFEQSPGVVVAQEVVAGSCQPLGFTCDSTQAGTACSFSSLSDCESAPCPAGETCVVYEGECCTDNGIEGCTPNGSPCDEDTPCSGPLAQQCIPTLSLCLYPCANDPDCGPPAICSGTGEICTIDADCPDEFVRFTGVAPADSLDVVQCDPAPVGNATPINSNDALACIGSVEAVVGHACVP